MRAVEFFQRAAGKSPGYIARRALREANRRVRARSLRRRLAALTREDVAREARAPSLQELWSRASEGFRLAAGEIGEVRALYGGPYAAEAEALRARAEKILAHEWT